MSTVSIHRGFDAIGQAAERNLQLISSTAGALLDQLFTNAQRLQIFVATTKIVLAACSTPPIQRQELLPSVEQRLKEVLSSDPDFGLAYVADENEVCLVSTSPNMVGRDYSATREYMRCALMGIGSDGLPHAAWLHSLDNGGPQKLDNVISSKSA